MLKGNWFEADHVLANQQNITKQGEAKPQTTLAEFLLGNDDRLTKKS